MELSGPERIRNEIRIELGASDIENVYVRKRALEAAMRAVEPSLTVYRKELADIVRSLLPKNPDNEADQAIEWALNKAAQAVERGHR